MGTFFAVISIIGIAVTVALMIFVWATDIDF